VILERRGYREGVGCLLRRSLLALGLLGSLAWGRAAAAGEEIRVLLLSGQNNHDWKATTPELLAILRESGGFAIDVNEKPELITVRLLEPYDVILSNWNSFGLDLRGSDWPAEARAAYLDFVRRGKGHVVVHAGSSSFPDWGDYRRLTLANWKMGQTSHGPSHEFAVRMENASHPVTAGLRTFTTTDELWRRPGLVEEAEVLASSFSAADTQGTKGWEPAVLAGRFGEGRSLTVLLGHDVRAMASPGFRQLVRRAVEWAATGKVAARNSQWLREDGALTLGRSFRAAVAVPLQSGARHSLLPSAPQRGREDADVGPAARPRLAPRAVIQLEVHQRRQLLGDRRQDRSACGPDHLVQREGRRR
jgi:type 1 glutamine amidotransferase